MMVINHSRDYFHVNHDNNDGIAQKNRRKRKLIEYDTPPPTNQASTSSVSPQVPIMNA